MLGAIGTLIFLFYFLNICSAFNRTSILGLEMYTSIIFLDVDECEADEDPCNSNAVCNNTLGSFTCTGKINFYPCTNFFLLVYLGSFRDILLQQCNHLHAYGQFNMHVLCWVRN